MLRVLVIALVAANLGFLAWTAGWLDRFVGTSTRSEREPERVLRQVRPETIRVIAPGAPLPASAPAASSAASSLACLQSNPLSAAQATAVDAALRRVQPALPDRSWADEEVAGPAGGWLVYMGRFAGPDALARKQDELRRRRIDFDVLSPPGPLAPGLALGRYADRPAAEEALAALARQDVHTARIVAAPPATPTHVLRFGSVDPITAAQLAGLQGEVYGSGFTRCTAMAASVAAGPR